MPAKTKTKLAEREEPIVDEPDTGPDEIEMVDFVFRGATFSIPKEMDEWDTEACLAIGEDDYMRAAKILLGPGQWAVLQTLGSKRKDIREFLVVLGLVVKRECVQ